MYICGSTEWFYDLPGMAEKKEHLYTAVPQSIAAVAHRFWAHIGSIPWTISRSTNLPASVAARGVYRTLGNLFTPLPHCL